MNYLLHLNGRYLFNRRVPDVVRGHDKRLYVRASLKTDSRKEALQRVSVQNAHLEEYWKQLIETGTTHTSEGWKVFNKAMRLNRFGAMRDHGQRSPAFSSHRVTHKDNR